MELRETIMATFHTAVDLGANLRRSSNTNTFNINAEAANNHTGSAAGNGADEALNGLLNQFGTMGITNGNMASAGPAMQGVNHNAFMPGPDGGIVFAAPYGAPLHPLLADHPAFGPAYPIPYNAGGYAAAFASGMMPIAPARPVGFGDHVPRELPVLETRRSSYSTSATESAPATPYFGNNVDRLNGGTRIASFDHTSFTTPSPRDNGNCITGNSQSKAIVDDAEIERLLLLEPPVPKAVPAVWTEHTKPLEQCLKNRIQGNHNVYIRGLHPTTDDDLLLKYAERFGSVEQSKAIIDTATGACKGFGFAKFKDVAHSETCIRGFYRLGYEVGFARESFNARLKAEGDNSSTNLYVSNLPKDINEAMLIHIFEPFHIISSKILRDSMGNSRGVGFARFESRDICEKVVKHFNGLTVGQEHYVMQVRYADTPSQKELKRITAERRQYRTNEYNIGAYGTHAVGMNPSIYGQPMWPRRSVASSSFGARSQSAVRPVSRTGALRQTRSAERGSSTQDQQSTEDTSVQCSDSSSGDEGTTVVEPPAVEKPETDKPQTEKAETDKEN